MTGPQSPNGRVTRRTLAAFLLAGILGLALFVLLYDRAFPEASLDLKVSRSDVESKSREFLKGRGFDLAGYRSVVVFTSRRQEIDFLERNLGLAKANALFRRTVAVWRWRIRWFRQLEEVEYNVEYTPDGRLAGFRRKLPDAAPGARPEEIEARRLGETYLSGSLGIDLSKYRYIGRTMEDRPKRLDQGLTWRLNAFDNVAGSEYRIGVTLQGDQVGAFDQWVRIPESWTRAREERDSRRQILARLDRVPMILLNLLWLGILFWRAQAGGIRWRWALATGGAVGTIIPLAGLNHLPLAWLSYNTTQSFGIFWTGQAAALVIGTVVAMGFLAWLFASTDVVGRLYLGDRPWCSAIFTRRYFLSDDLPRHLLMGYGLAFASLGYVTLFYVLGQRYFGVWSPVDVPVGNAFSTFFPAIEAIRTGLFASVTEELVFRLLAIALLYKATGRVWISVVIPAMIWGFAHTTYPQEPIWIRGVELTLSGTVFGLVFLRYGLLSTLVFHYVYDAFLCVVPQLRSGQTGLIATGFAAVALPVLLLVAARFLLKGRVGVPESEPEATVPEAPPPACVEGPAESLPPEAFVPASPLLTGSMLLGLVLAAALLYGGSRMVPAPEFFGKAPAVRLTRGQGARAAEKALAEAGFDGKGYASFTEFEDDTERLPDYAVLRFGVRGAWDRFRQYYGYRPTWETRWYQEKSARRYEVSVDDRGKPVAFDIRLPDDEPGGKPDEVSAGRIADAFLSRERAVDREQWERIETSRNPRPNRIDYTMTYRDRGFEADGLRRKLTVGIAGGVVTAFGPPWYDVPESWSRERAVKAKEPRNTVRSVVVALLGVGAGLFLIVGIVSLFRAGICRGSDVKAAAVWALVVGAVPAFCEFLNGLPHFYHGYFNHTEQALSTYAFSTMMEKAGKVLLSTPLLVFVVVLLVQVAYRGWMPGRPEFRVLLDRLRPSRWGSAETRQGVILGLVAIAFDHGVGNLVAFCKGALSPAFHSLDAATTGIDVGQLSELLKVVDKIPGTVMPGLCVLFAAVAVTRFLKREGWRLALLVVATFLMADLHGVSWRELGIDWAFGLARALAVYFMVTRVLRWNLMAYLVMFWADNPGALQAVKRFAFSGSPEFAGPSVVQLAVTVLPVAMLFLWGYAPMILTSTRFRRRPSNSP